MPCPSCRAINNNDTGCRVRGYQYKSEGGGEPRKNPPSYRYLEDRRAKLDDGKKRLTEASLMPSPDIDAHDMEMLGFAERDS